MKVEVTTYYLEMTSLDELRPRHSPRDDLLLAQVSTPMPELNRFLYTAVGGQWFWFERLPWTYQKWIDYLGRPELETWLLLAAGVPAGYFELEALADGNAEIVYFGLLPCHVGQGLGAHLLTEAVERAWSRGARRVWLHTCTLDHPNALAHYQARGFRVFREEVKSMELPDETPGPWPGAQQSSG